MEIGMLWYDDGPLPVKDRVKAAAGYYSEKYGRKPNLCLVHPGMLKSDEGKVNGIVIRKGKGVMPGHFWIGVDETQTQSTGNRPKRKVSKATATAKTTAKSRKSKTASKVPQAAARQRPHSKAA